MQRRDLQFVLFAHLLFPFLLFQSKQRLGNGLILYHLFFLLKNKLLLYFTKIMLFLELNRSLLLGNSWLLSELRSCRSWLLKQVSELSPLDSVFDLIARSSRKMFGNEFPAVGVLKIASLENLVFLPSPCVLLETGV